MMSLQAEASDGDEGGSAEGPNSELAFQTHVMKVGDMVRTERVAFTLCPVISWKLCHATGIA